jgi:Domain of unknown function (DUF4345)
MSTLLEKLSLTTGAACTGIGLFHLLGGTSSVPGERGAGATVDSRERFYGAIFGGYGLAWLRAGRQSPTDPTEVRWLAGIFLLGGAGRLLSLARTGRPHWFQDVLTGVELALPPVFFWLADRSDAHAVALDPASHPNSDADW